jgi:hypothetical protein
MKEAIKLNEYAGLEIDSKDSFENTDGKTVSVFTICKLQSGKFGHPARMSFANKFTRKILEFLRSFAVEALKELDEGVPNENI